MTDKLKSFVLLRTLNFRHEEISLYSGKCGYVSAGENAFICHLLSLLPCSLLFILKTEPVGIRLWTLGCFQSRISTPPRYIFSPHRNLLPLLFVLLWFNDTKHLPFAHAASCWNNSSTLRSCDSALSDLLKPLSVPSCHFRKTSSRHQLPLGPLPLPPHPCSTSVFTFLQPRNSVTRIAFLVSRSDLVPSSLSTFDAFSCRIKPKLSWQSARSPSWKLYN